MMRARKGDEADFTKDTKRYGVEVFEDVNNGNIIYISETGSIVDRGAGVGRRPMKP
jgi:hypothetical protein